MLTYFDLGKDQRDCIRFIEAGEDSLIAADVGTGKTVIALTAAARALESGEVTRWLVLAPLLVATDTWAKEPALWKHLEHLKVAIACGNIAKRQQAIWSDAQIVVMNYENLNWLLKEAYARGSNWRNKPDPLPFDGLICDEIDKLKDVRSERFKAIRSRIGIFKKRIGLTGTLIPNKLTELWGQVYMVDGGQTFGRSFYKWRQKYFFPIDYKQYDWKPFHDTPQQLIDALDGLVYRLKATGLPKVVYRPPVYFELPDDLRKTYKKLGQDFYVILNKQEEFTTVDAVNSAVLVGKLQQITAGFSYVNQDSVPLSILTADDTQWQSKKKPVEVHWHTLAKYTRWLVALSMDTKQLLIVYNYRAELTMLQTIYPDLAYLGGGVSNAKARQHIDAWNRGELRRLALHPASAGHGLNLQLSGAHDIAFLTLPWSGGMFHQVIGRLARRGALVDHVNVHTCLFKDTIDEMVYATVTGKLTKMTGFLDAFEKAGRQN